MLGLRTYGIQKQVVLDFETILSTGFIRRLGVC